jgi:hypothetical protein
MPQYKEDPWEVRYHAEIGALRFIIAKREEQFKRTTTALNVARIELLRATLAVQSDEPKAKVIECLERAMAIEVRATDPVVLAADEIMDDYQIKINNLTGTVKPDIDGKLMESLKTLNEQKPLQLTSCIEAMRRIIEKLLAPNDKPVPQVQSQYVQLEGDATFITTMDMGNNGCTAILLRANDIGTIDLSEFKEKMVHYKIDTKVGTE